MSKSLISLREKSRSLIMIEFRENALEEAMAKGEALICRSKSNAAEMVMPLSDHRTREVAFRFGRFRARRVWVLPWQYS